MPAHAASALVVGLLAGGAATVPAIQGAAHRSPLAGHDVDGVEGVVTAVLDEGGERGFWMQARGDGDEATSDALLVVGGELPPSVAPGDRVRVDGRVEERAGRRGELTVTRLALGRLELVERGAPLPAPVVLGRGGRPVPGEVADDDRLERFEPDADALDFWESLEGMRLALPDAVVVGPTTGYGVAVVVTDGGAGAGPRTDAGGLARSEKDANPERLAVRLRAAPAGPPGRGTGRAGEAPELAVGDRFDGPLVGVLTYAHGGYELLPTEPLPAVVRSGRAPESTALAGDDAHLVVATLNALNLSAADEPERFAALGRVLVERLASPDVVALQEIGDDSGPEDDGVVGSARTLERLVAAAAAAGGPRYRALWVDPLDGAEGGRPGLNVRVAFLVRPDRVDVPGPGPGGSRDEVALERRGGARHLAPNPGRLATDHPCFRADDEGRGGTRRPLALEVRFHGTSVFLIANHLLSKGGDDPLLGAVQPPRRPSEARRACQAEVVAAFAAELLEADPAAAVVVLGDLNEHEGRPPLARLTAVGLEDLVERLPLADRYTFGYRGNSQVLDHVLVSPSLAAGAAIDAVHCHADFPPSRRASDHDPLLARLRVAPLADGGSPR